MSIASQPLLLADTGPFCRFAEAGDAQIDALVGYLGTNPITITDKRLLDQIENIVQGRRRHAPGHFMEDRGEVATILVAKTLGCPVLIDDRWGKDKFAVQKGVLTFSTEDLAVEMASAGAMGTTEAFEVYRRVYGSGRATFDARSS